MARYSEEALVAVVYLFEQENGKEIDSFEVEAIKEHSLEGLDPMSISKFLVDDIRSDKLLPDSYRQSAYWALSKRYDKLLIPFFRERLATEVSLGAESVFQLLIALEDLDESVFSQDRGGSYSSLDNDLNLRDAQLYLNLLS